MSTTATMPERDAQVVRHLRRCRVVPVATIEDPECVEGVARALVAGGVPCLEITFRHPAAAEAIRRAAAIEGLLVGAGTVLTPDQVDVAAAAGAHFGVAPGTSEDVVARAAERGLPFFPGVATPSEMEHARRLGRLTVKVFPAAQLGGPAFLQAVAATYPDLGFVPTGGIGEGNLADYLAVPSVLACGGSWLVGPELVRAGRYEEIERLARAASELAR